MKLVLNTSVTRSLKNCEETLHTQSEISIKKAAFNVICFSAVINGDINDRPFEHLRCSSTMSDAHLLFESSLRGSDQISLHPSDQFGPEETDSVKEAVFEAWQQSKRDVKVLLHKKMMRFVPRVFEFLVAHLSR